jgi:hypothetical protein
MGALRHGFAAWGAALGAVVAALAGALSSCSPSDFEPQSKIDTVRVFAARADEPYAKPGDTVNLTLLTYDGRPQQPSPMQTYWLPFVCVNPAKDAYYACFGGAGGDGGAASDAGGGALGLLKPGVNLSPFLPQGPAFPVPLPADIVTSHAPVMSGDPYGVAIAFNISCAGHVEIVALDPSSKNPLQVPVGCFDDQENQLGSDDYVLGFARVYAYTSRTNANPVIDHVLFQGYDVLGAGSDGGAEAGAGPDAATDAGPDAAPDAAGDAGGDAGPPVYAGLSGSITTPPCTQNPCPDLSIDVDVPPSSQEPDPGNVSPDGVQLSEQIWADYFVSIGDVSDNARLLYDPSHGRITPSANKLHVPTKAGDGFLWIVVHDSRGGAAWATIALHVH